MGNMERVLALQALADIAPVDSGAAESNMSTGCSSQSSGTGNSSCSVKCNDAESMDW